MWSGYIFKGQGYFSGRDPSEGGTLKGTILCDAEPEEQRQKALKAVIIHHAWLAAS